MVKNYTQPISEESFRGKCPPILEFSNPWETSCIQVTQGNGEISKCGRIIQSAGFADCFGILLRNTNNLETALFHVDYTEFNREQRKVVGEFIELYLRKLNISSKEKKKLRFANAEVMRGLYPGNYGNLAGFQKRMEELNGNKTIQARFIYGTMSEDIKDRITESFFNFFGIHVKEDLVINSGNHYWSMLYKPKTDEILAYADSKNKLKTFKF